MLLFCVTSYLSAVTEKITGRTEDTCPDDPRADEEGYSTGRAKNDMGDARMDIFKSEIACEITARPDGYIFCLRLHVALMNDRMCILYY